MSYIMVFNDTVNELHHGCSRVMNNIYQLVNNYGYQIKSVYVNSDWTLSEKIKSDIIGAKLIIVNGEGTIHHNAFFAIKLLEVSKFAKFYRKKIFLINATIQEMTLPNVFSLLSNFDRIYVRESLSYEYLLSLGIESVVVPDMTFYSSVEDKKVTAKGVAVTCSVYEEYSYNLGILAEKLQAEYCAINYRGIPRFNLLKLNDVNVLKSFIQRCLRHLKSIDLVLNKLIFRRNFNRLFNRIPVVVFNDHISYQEYLSNKELMVCGRFHAMCMSISCFTPVVTLESNSYKVSGVINDIGLDKKRIISISELNQITEDFRYNYSDNEVEAIQNYTEKATKLIDAMFNDIFSA